MCSKKLSYTFDLQSHMPVHMRHVKNAKSTYNQNFHFLGSTSEA